MGRNNGSGGRDKGSVESISRVKMKVREWRMGMREVLKQ